MLRRTRSKLPQYRKSFRSVLELEVSENFKATRMCFRRDSCKRAGSVGGERCPKGYYVQNATAKGLLPAVDVTALAKNPSWVSRLETVKIAREPADADAMFAAVQARSNRQIQKQLNPTRSIAIKMKGYSMANKLKRAWTKADVRTLKTLAKKKTRASSIARTLKRAEGATRQRAFSMGLSLDSRA